MTDDPCDGCPFAGCPSCQHQGGDDPNTCAKSAVIWDNWTGNDERPTAPTVSRSSHSDSPERKEGVAQ